MSSSMRLGVPFIAPRQLGAVESNLGRQFLPSVVWRTGQSGAHATEGKNCLPRLLSTAPSCLGAIKGTPRRMKENTKHPLSTIDHSHIILAHLFDILVI